jgi:hypothetical protein
MEVAKHVLETELDLLIPLGYVGFRCMVLTRIFTRSDEGYDNRGAGNIVFAAASLMFLAVFINISAGDIWKVSEAHAAWGALVVFLGLGVTGLLGVMEWIHRQDQQYVDLSSGNDEERCKREAAKYEKAKHIVQVGTLVWMALFAGATAWLWQISLDGKITQ